MELESKLASYRAKKSREEQLNNVKNKFRRFFHLNQSETAEKQDLLEKSPEVDYEPEKAKPAFLNHVIKDDKLEDEEATNDVGVVGDWLKIGYHAIGFVAWAILYYVFITLQFGIVFLIVSALFGIYFNTRTGPKNEGEVSAYSVFNRNCESIGGTLKAEQFEREIRFGAINVH